MRSPLIASLFIHIRAWVVAIIPPTCHLIKENNYLYQMHSLLFKGINQLHPFLGATDLLMWLVGWSSRELDSTKVQKSSLNNTESSVPCRPSLSRYILPNRILSTAICAVSHTTHWFLYQHGLRHEPNGPRGNHRIDGSPFACMV